MKSQKQRIERLCKAYIALHYPLLAFVILGTIFSYFHYISPLFQSLDEELYMLQRDEEIIEVNFLRATNDITKLELQLLREMESTPFFSEIPYFYEILLSRMNVILGGRELASLERTIDDISPIEGLRGQINQLDPWIQRIAADDFSAYGELLPKISGLSDRSQEIFGLLAFEAYESLFEQRASVSEKRDLLRGILGGTSAILVLAIVGLAIILRIAAQTTLLANSRNLEVDSKNQELTEINEKLVETSQALADASRAAGMAQVASGVLHTIGNEFNSLITSVNKMSTDVRGAKVSQGLVKMVQLFKKNEENGTFWTDQKKLKACTAYINQLESTLSQSQDEFRKEHERIKGKIRIITAILKAQERYTENAKEVKQKFPVSKLINDTIDALSAQIPLMDYRIKIENEARIDQVIIDVSYVQQILRAFLENAYDACKIKSYDGEIQIRFFKDPESGRFAIAVKDTGVGILQEHKKKIFSPGFTTKPDGYGSSLHDASNAARVIGGELHFESEGMDKGSEFTLYLPLSAEENSPEDFSVSMAESQTA